MYYPDQRPLSSYTVIQRDVMLPDEASGTLRTTEGHRVDIRDVVAQGIVSNGYVIIEAAQFFGLRNPERLERLMQVNVGDIIKKQDVLAGKNARRGKRLFSPVRGVVAQVSNGRIMLQAAPTIVDLEAGVRGKVMAIYEGRGVTVESIGARVQGFWGNNRNTIASLRLGPEGEFTDEFGDTLDRRYTGSIVLLRKPLTRGALDLVTEQGFAGIIAPSMDARLRPMALELNTAILLTEGFGKLRMSTTVFNLLQTFDGSQVTLDATMPNRWQPRRPEIVINVPSKDRTPSRPNPRLKLDSGMEVRLKRDPNMGTTGNIVDLPESPILLDNGLRVMAAQVQLVTGETMFVPLANLEVLGR